jgi:hypothetical protein
MPSADRLNETIEFAAGRVRLEAPGNGVQASVSSNEAFQRASSVGVYAGEYPPNRIVLALYSNDDYGPDESPPGPRTDSSTAEERASQSEAREGQQRTSGPMPGVRPYFQRHLVWAFLFYNKPYNHGRAGVIPSNFVIVVDAKTGEALQTTSQPSPEWVAEYERTHSE